MKRTTVALSDELDAMLRKEATLRGVSVSELTRTAIEQLLGLKPGQRRRLSFAGIGASNGDGTISERIDEFLAQAAKEGWPRPAADR